MTRWYRTGVSHGRHQRECSDVHDHADLVAPIALYDARLVKSRGLHDGSRPVATRIELLTVDHAVGDRVAHPEDRDAVGDEALDLVHVETLVDPVDEQGLGRVGLRADLAVLALVDLVGRDDQREDAERRLGERLRPSRTPRAHAHGGVPVELLPSGDGHDNGGREAGAVGGWPETRRDPAAFRLSLFIPSGAASPARSVAGLRQGPPRLRSASRHSLQVAESALEDSEHRRSEEHTSELQSQSNLVCRLLLEKKKNNTEIINL